ncbi:hypothetical protein [Paenibacillus sp. B2(2019)]|uniref:hypothetical protein n=1 Tax=Paenibacillus sp. B2(2019) TaxID=2607754 RepID=UPI0011F2A6BE|nr:hypothetical protein [Paenibacillus sp. B2(2019)]KAA1180666.1 hypothetical protein PAENI_25780 [Paenibacillus sp. B2(2019)]
MTPAERREKYLLNEFDRIFESLEYRLFEHLAAADHIVAKIISEASTAGIGLSTSQKVVRAKIEDMIDQIAEKRELETPKRARKDSK